jgi:hypothetical protein
MSLPGLELAEAAVEAQYAPPPPTQVNLRAGSEWRFEITFGATVRVKVCSALIPRKLLMEKHHTNYELSYSPAPQNSSEPNSRLYKHIHSAARKRQYIPGMDAR